MSNLGTFDTFTTAQLGIYAAQHGLRVTGNNISNISTDGYTRQRIDQVSFKVGGGDMYRSQLDNHVGSGALVTGISQIRDPYLDIRYRNTSSDVGYTDTWLAGLQNIAAILNEVGKGLGEDNEDGLLYAQLQDLAKSLRGLSENPSSGDDTLVRTSAEALCTLFNTYADRLEALRQNTEDAFKKDISAVNTILTNIRNLNEEIRNSEIHGDSALEMRDERNRQIDALSEYMHINVVYSMEDIGAGQEVEKLTITLANDNPDGEVTTDSSMLIDGIYGAQISMQTPKLNPDYVKGSTYDPDDDTTWPYWNDDLDDGNGGKGAPVATAAEATMLDTPNYDITISKLYDSKGRMWTNPVTTWTKVEGNENPDQAQFRFEITKSLWVDGNKFTIGDTTYTIGDPADGGDITAADAMDLTKMAEFIAGKLTSTDYTITSEGAYIVYTAINPGKPGTNPDPPAPTPPASVPDLALRTPKLNPNYDPNDPASLKYWNDDQNQAVANANDATMVKENKITFRRTTDNPGYTTTPVKDPDDPDPNPSYEYDPDTGAKVTKTEVVYTQSNGDWFRVQVVTQYSREVTLDDNDLYGSLQATRELLTERGEFATADIVGDPENGIAGIDENALIKRGIPYYQLSLDLLARQVATQYNSLNQGYMVNQNMEYIDENGKPLTIRDIDTGEDVIVRKDKDLTDGQKANLINNGFILKDQYGNDVVDEKGEPVPDIQAALKALNAVPADGMGNLFSIRNDKDVDSEEDPDTGETIRITAANITVSKGWSKGSTKVVTTYVQLFGEDGEPLPNTTQNENVNHMITMIEEPLVYDPKMMVEGAVGDNLFTGCFNDMFSNIMSVEGKDQRIMNVRLTTSYGSLVELGSSRDGVSGVDLNDEAMNMMQYQKAYSAACRMMTVIDEVLDRLINNTGVAGR